MEPPRLIAWDGGDVQEGSDIKPYPTYRCPHPPYLPHSGSMSLVFGGMQDDLVFPAYRPKTRAARNLFLRTKIMISPEPSQIEGSAWRSRLPPIIPSAARGSRAPSRPPLSRAGAGAGGAAHSRALPRAGAGASGVGRGRRATSRWGARGHPLTSQSTRMSFWTVRGQSAWAFGRCALVGSASPTPSVGPRPAGASISSSKTFRNSRSQGSSSCSIALRQASAALPNSCNRA